MSSVARPWIANANQNILRPMQHQYNIWICCHILRMTEQRGRRRGASSQRHRFQQVMWVHIIGSTYKLYMGSSTAVASNHLLMDRQWQRTWGESCAVQLALIPFNKPVALGEVDTIFPLLLWMQWLVCFTLCTVQLFYWPFMVVLVAN